MKVLSRKAFLAMPAGTVFWSYEPHPNHPGTVTVGPVRIKDQTCGVDFYETGELGKAIAGNSSEDVFAAEERALAGESVAMDFDTICREGYFDDQIKYAVLETPDLTALIARLQQALVDSTTGPSLPE